MTEQPSTDPEKPANYGDVHEAPTAPTVLNITHHSIELSWDHPVHEPLAKRPKYFVKEEGAGIVYNGYATHQVFTGLNALTQYKYCVQMSNEIGPGLWSSAVTVTTLRQPKTCENLHKAINWGDTQSVKAILEDNPHYIDVPDIYGSSPLMSACSQNKNEIVSLLLDMGVNVEYSNSGGKTSLMGACYCGNLEGAKLVVARGASWTSRDRSGFSALHYAVDGGHLPTVNYILAEGVEVDDASESTVSGWTPLMRTASFGGNVQVAQALVEAGADVNRRDKDGKTPLMLASLNGYKGIAQLLMDNGANPQAKNQYGKSAKDFAETFNHYDILEIMESKEKVN